MTDSKVETISRLAQWRIDNFGPCSYKKSDPFKLGIWNWYTHHVTHLYILWLVSFLCCEWLCLNCYRICMCDVWFIVYYSQVHFHRTEQVPLHTYLSWAFSAFQGTATCSSLHPTSLQQLWPYPQVLHLPWSVPHCYSLVPFPLQ